MRELSSPLDMISSTSDILRAFASIGFVISYLPIKKISNDSVSCYQISCLPRYSKKQQFRLANTVLESLGFSTSEITVDVGSVDLQRRSYIKAVHKEVYITYHVDLGILEIYLGM